MFVYVLLYVQLNAIKLLPSRRVRFAGLCVFLLLVYVVGVIYACLCVCVLCKRVS